MSLLLKVRQNVPQVQSIKTSLKKRAGRKLPCQEKTPFDVIYKHEIISLRHYRNETEASAKHRVPLVIVPPFSCEHAHLRFVPYPQSHTLFLDQGFEVYLIDGAYLPAIKPNTILAPT